MLHEKSVEPGTLELIKKLQADPLLESFVLVGGTALALHLGHRLSIDIDLFSQTDFDASILLEHLEQSYSFSLQFQHQNTLKGIIDGVFVDLLTHPYPQIESTHHENGIRLMSVQDIAAMKVNAIAGNGTRVKDFIDLYFLSKSFNFNEILDFYKRKYANRNTFHALKSLTYFDEIDFAAWPILLKEKGLSPKKLQKVLLEKRDQYQF